MEANQNTNISQRPPGNRSGGIVHCAGGCFVDHACARPNSGLVQDWLGKNIPSSPTSTPTDSISTGTPAPVITPTFLESILDLAGETTLQKAREQADFTIALPTYPADLNDPDQVFVQQFGGPVVTLVWMDPNHPDKVRLSLSKSRSEKAVFEKIDPASLQETQVNDNPAVWVDSDYLLIMRNGDTTFTRLIDQGHTLIWTNGEITYRLETSVDLDTAIRIAESIP